MAYIDALNDADHMRFSGQGLLRHNVDSHIAYVKGFNAGPHYLLALQPAGEYPTAVGYVSVYFAENHSSADVQIMVLPLAKGRGIGKEAWCAVIEQLAGRVDSVTAGCARANGAMIALMDAAGFILDGVEEGTLETARGPQDAFYFRRDFSMDLPKTPNAKDER